MAPFEVCITILEPYSPEVRLPPLASYDAAKLLATACAAAYPAALIEISHNEMRYCFRVEAA